jgi:hypothetical protein
MAEMIRNCPAAHRIIITEPDSRNVEEGGSQTVVNTEPTIRWVYLLGWLRGHVHTWAQNITNEDDSRLETAAYGARTDNECNAVQRQRTRPIYSRKWELPQSVNHII